MSLQAVILAGGLGTRLRPITETVPKPMVPVAGRPYLEYQIDWLRKLEITNVVLLVGYLAEQVEGYFGDGRRFGVTIAYSREPRPLGTGGALKLALPLLAESFLVLNGDSYLPVDYRPLAALLESSGAEAVLAAYDNALGDTGVRHNLDVAGDGRVLRYEKGSRTPMTHVDAGAFMLRRRVLALTGAPEFSLENELFPALIARRQLFALPVRQRFYDMGTPAGLAMLEEFLKR
ncbi:MAG TPA: nucleotidyltransferase family protein [Bryobacteraceae bacterium]|nr:nucleotidyltransferase family protein [Bryobacteraceae bacterium]